MVLHLLRSFVLLVVACLSSTVAEAQVLSQAQAQSSRPNIVIIWGDDIGQTDVSAYSRGLMGYQTPNIDRVAKEGVMFTDYYGEQSCTAGRSAFITGQSVFRTGLSKVGLPGADLGLIADNSIVMYSTDNGPHMNSALRIVADRGIISPATMNRKPLADAYQKRSRPCGKPAVGIDVFPDQRGQGAAIRAGEPVGPRRLGECLLDHERVDVDHGVLQQVQRQHADFVVLPPVVHLSLLSSERTAEDFRNR